MEKLLRFDDMITPKIITLVYWLALGAAAIGGLMSCFVGMGRFSAAGLLMGLAIALGGALVARITCELLIVLFKIHENIHSLAKAAGTSSVA